MSLYGGIDLHANNSVAVLLNEQDQVIYHPSLKSQGTHRPAQDGKTRTIKRLRLFCHHRYTRI